MTPELLASQVRSELDQINSKIDRICDYIELTKNKEKKPGPVREPSPNPCKSKKGRSLLAPSTGGATQPGTIGIDLRRKLSSTVQRDGSASIHSLSKTSTKTKTKPATRTLRQKLTLRSLATENPRNSSVSSISCRTPNNRTRPLLLTAMKETQSMDSHAYFPQLKSVQDTTYDSHQLSAAHTHESVLRSSCKPACPDRHRRADDSREQDKQ